MDCESRIDSTWALAFETSTARGSIALGRGRQVLETRQFSAPRKHAVEFLPTIESLCHGYGIKPAAIRWVFVSIGPGSFTGLRIGVTAARMLALATGASIVAVPTAEAIAENALDATTPPRFVAVLLDAKRSRVFAATFSLIRGAYVPVSEPMEAEPGDYLGRQDPSCAVIGEGVAYHRPAVEASRMDILPETLWPPRAETVYRLGFTRAARGDVSNRRTLVPLYIRPPEAEEKFADTETRPKSQRRRKPGED